MNDRVRSPITWFGGKSRMCAKLLPMYPEHTIYLEAFGGGGSLLFAKEPSTIEVYNDLDSGLVTLFRVLRDPEKAARLYMLASQTPYSREEYYRCRDTWSTPSTEVERAYRWFVVARMSFGGLFGASWGFGVTTHSRGMAQRPASWISMHEMIGRINSRLMRVQIEHDDFRKVIPRYDSPETFHYLDPPYVTGTRKSGSYAHELSDDDHRELVAMLLDLKGTAMLSGYKNDLYKPLERAGWRRRDFPVKCSVNGRTRAMKDLEKELDRVESVWMSPSISRGKYRPSVKLKLAGNPIHIYPVRRLVA